MSFSLPMVGEDKPNFYHVTLKGTSTVETNLDDSSGLRHQPAGEDNTADEPVSTSATDVLSKEPQKPKSSEAVDDVVKSVRHRIVSQLKNLDSCLYAGDEDQLIEAYELLKRNRRNSAKQPFNVVLITGADSTGTSALANSLIKAAEKDEDVYMVSGRFDGFRACAIQPFKAYIEAFSQFADRVAAEGEEAVELIRAAVKEKVSVTTQPLTDLVPALIQILGDEQVDPSSRPVHRCGNIISRFVVVLQAFVRAITSKKPMVMVLENLHLADPCSLHFMMVLARETGVSLVCTCLDGDGREADDTASSVSRRLQNANVGVKRIQVQNLLLDEVEDLVSDILRLPNERIASLASILSTQTRGNVVFVLEAMKSLQEQGLLTYTDNRWIWDESQVLQHLGADSLRDFLNERVKSLPAALKELLKVASCLGSKLDEDMLSYALSAPVGYYLALAADQGLLKHDQKKDEYSFVHDGIQSASYELIEPKEREKFHLAVARRLYRCLEREELRKHVYVVLNQFQQGKSLISSNEKYFVVDISILAAQEAFKSSSFRISAACVTFGISLLDRNSFKEEYDLCVALHTNAAEAYFVMDDHARMEESIDAVLRNASNFRDKIGVLTTQAHFLNTQNRSSEADEVAQSVLSGLGVAVESHPSRVRIMAEFKRIKSLLKNKSDQSIIRMQWMERMTHPDTLTALKLLNALFLNAHISESKRASLIGLKMVELTLQRGLSAASSFGFAIYGYLLMSDGDIDQGYAYSQLALSIVERFNAKEWIPRVRLLVYGYIQPWKVSVSECLGPLKGAHKIGLESGDHEYSMLCANLYATNAIDFLPADELLGECNDFASQMVRSKQDMALEWMESIRTTLKVLVGDEPCSPVLTSQSDRGVQPKSDPTSDTFSLVVTSYHQMLLSCIFRDINACKDLVRGCWEEVMKKEYESYLFADFVFVCGLASAESIRSCSWREQAYFKTILKRAIKKLQTWSKSSPRSTCSKLFLLQAEHAALRNQAKGAAKEYLVAIATARSAGFQYEIALGNELAGRFYLSRRKKEEAIPYYEKALEAYASAKAIAKVKDIRQELDLLLEA